MSRNSFHGVTVPEDNKIRERVKAEEASLV